jgi:hypothetical protein
MDTVASAWSVVIAAYTVIDFFVSVVSADEDCKQLVRELYTTTRMVDNIRLLAKENAEKLEQLNGLLVPNGGLDQFRHTVDELSSRILESKGTIKEGYKRVKFVLRRKTVQELLQTIQRQQTPFIACLGAENMSVLLFKPSFPRLLWPDSVVQQVVAPGDCRYQRARIQDAIYDSSSKLERKSKSGRRSI